MSELFGHMAQEHGKILLDTELEDIRVICRDEDGRTEKYYNLQNGKIVAEINTAVMLLEADMIGRDGTLYVTKKRVAEAIKSITGEDS